MKKILMCHHFWGGSVEKNWDNLLDSCKKKKKNLFLNVGKSMLHLNIFTWDENFLGWEYQ